MTEVYLKLNKETGRYDCYTVMDDKCIKTLTCGNSFIYMPDDEDIEVPGRIEHSINKGYYWIDTDDFSSIGLHTGMRGYIE